MMPPRLEHGVHDPLWGLVRTRQRPPAPIRQAVGSFLLVAIDPLVGRLAANLEAIGELRHRLQAAVEIGDELLALVHG